MRKLFAVVVLVAAVGATALVPASASADKITRTFCIQGVGANGNTTYCETVTFIVCVVPELKGDTKRQAGRALAAHDCRLGKVTKRKHKKGKKGRVFKQSAKPGSIHNQGFKVNVTIKK